MVKIAFLLPDLQSGGVQKVVSLVANAMVDRGHEVEIVILGETGESAQELNPAIDVIMLEKTNPLKATLAGIMADPLAAFVMARHLFALRNRSKTLGFLPDLARYLDQNRPDVLYSATPFLNMDAVLARRIAGTDFRLVMSEHSHLSTGKPRKIWRAKKLRHAMAHCYRKADAIVAVSHGVAEDLAATLKLENDRITVLHNPIVPDDVTSLIDQPMDHAWFQDRSTPTLLSIGRPSYQKDYETVIRALALANQEQDVRLAIIGSTMNTKKRRRTVQELLRLAQNLAIEEKISFLGWRANPFPYIANATAFVLSSRWEGLPSVLLEALACGTPIISTDSPAGPYEITDGGRYGKLVPVGDAEAMAAAILETLREPPAKSLLLERAKHYSYQRSIDGYEAILTSALPARD